MAKKGEKLSEEHKRKISETLKGREVSDETRRKLVKANTGKNHPMYGRRGEDNPNYGSKRSLETRKKQSEAKKGKSLSKEHKKNIGIAVRKRVLAGEYKRHKNWKGGKELAQKRKYVKLKNNLSHQLNKKVSNGINKSLKKGVKNSRNWESLVDYSFEELKSYLESTIPINYSWSDFLSGDLHIDHIIPISAFNFSLPEHIDFRRCWALENLRLLPKLENFKKGNKLIKSFQMALKIVV